MAKSSSKTARVTMREIARLAGGVDPSTVSLALRNSPSISLAVRRRIQALAAKAGYRRDPWLDAFNTRRLSSLVHRVQPVIAWVVDFDSRRALLASPRGAAMWLGASSAAEALHFQIEPFFLGPGALTPSRLESILRARGIESIVFAALQGGAPVDFGWERYGAVKIDGLDWTHPGYTVAADLRQGARVATQQAQQQRDRRVGLLLNATRGRAWNDLLLAGYLTELGARGQSGPIPPMETDVCPPVRTLAEWIRAHRIDCLLGDWVELGTVLRGGRAACVREMAWACLDATDAPAEVAGVMLPAERLGRLAIEQAVNLARTNQRGSFASASTTLVPVVWREGASLRPNE